MTTGLKYCLAWAIKKLFFSIVNFQSISQVHLIFVFLNSE